MAADDLKELFDARVKYSEIVDNLFKIESIISGFGYISEYNEIQNLIDKQKRIINKKISDLETFSLCEHKDITEEDWKGNDSHKDYYEDRCKSCGKIMKEYSV